MDASTGAIGPRSPRFAKIGGMKILISNDDGYLSPGIAMLGKVASEFGQVVVVAPDRDRSGASNSLTLDRPLTVRKAANGFMYVNGTPTDCVHVAITGMLGWRPDLVLSGINDGANMGDDTIYSGTVAAAMEGFQLGVPAIAFSIVKKGFEHLDGAGEVVRRVLKRWCEEPPSQAMLLNVNIPSLAADRIGSVRCTRLGKRHFAEPVIRATDPRGEPIWWIGPPGSARDAGPGTDFHAVETGDVSVTPLEVDLTGYPRLDSVSDWLSRA
jgi:5'-nucleotidase